MVKLVAHRGESIIAPENTLEAFAMAWVRGAKAIEGDFHLSKDGEVICMHDLNAKRTCGMDCDLASLTLDEIKKFDAGSWKGDQWRFTRVPTLYEVLEIMPDYGEIYIELKSVGPIVDALKAVFARGKWRPEQLTFIAFDEATIKAVKELFPDHKAYWLTGNNWNGDQPQFNPKELAQKLVDLGVDGVDSHFRHINKDYVDAVHAVGKTFHIWTVDDVEIARKMRNCGVDSITTNCPAVIAGEM